METSPPGGVAVTVKADDALPALVVTTTFPAATGALAGTVVVIEVELLAPMVAATPPMVTAAPASPVPVIVTTVFIGAETGDTRLIAGAGAGGGAVTVNAIVAAGVTLVVTTILPTPTVALIGTLVNICVPLLFPAFAATPPMLTVAPARFAPVMVTAVPGAPLATERLVMLGGNVGTGGGATAPPHPPVWMLSAPALKVTVTTFVEVQVTPLTMVVCAWLGPAAKPAKTIKAVRKIRVRETVFMNIL